MNVSTHDFEWMNDNFFVAEQVVFIMSTVIIGGILRTIDKKFIFLRPFQSCILFTLGALYGTIVRITQEKMTKDSTFINLMFHSINSIQSRYIEAIIIPLILFEVVHDIDIRTFTNLFLQIFTLVAVSFGICLTLKSAFLWFFVYEWHQWEKTDVILFSAFTSAYEPLIVLRILRDLGTYKTMSRLLEGEIFIMLTFVTFTQEVVEQSKSSQIDGVFLLRIFAVQIISGSFLGYFLGRLTVYWVQNILHDTSLEMIVIMSMSFLTAELGQILKISKALTVIVYCIILNDRKMCLSFGLGDSIRRMFEIGGFLAHTFVHVFAGFKLTNADWFVEMILDPANMMMGMSLFFVGLLLRGLGLHVILLLKRYYHISYVEICCMVWCDNLGIFTITFLLERYLADQTNKKFYLLYFHGCLCLLASWLVNRITTMPVLKLLGISTVSPARRLAVFKAFNNLSDITRKMASTYKADRFLADADWDIVMHHVEMHNPLERKYGSKVKFGLEEIEEAEFNRLLRKAQGEKIIGGSLLRRSLLRNRRPSSYLSGESSLNSSSKDLRSLASYKIGDGDLQKDSLQKEYLIARERIFRAKKTSFWKQYQHGMLSLDAVRTLVESIEYADTDINYQKNLNHIMKYAKVTGIHRIVLYLQNYHDESFKKDKSRLLASLIVESFLTRSVYSIMVLTNIGTTIYAVYASWECKIPNKKPLDSLGIFAVWINVAVVGGISLPILLLKSYAYRLEYFGLMFNKVKIVGLIISIFEAILTIYLHYQIKAAHLMCTDPKSEEYKMFLYKQAACYATRSLRLFFIFEYIGAVLVNFGDIFLQERLKLGYDIGKGYVTCEEEIFDVLESIIENPKVLRAFQMITLQLKKQRMAELAEVQKLYPGIVLSVKSQHAGRRILNDLYERTCRLRQEGVLDDLESEKLEKMIFARMKLLLQMPPEIPLPTPSKILEDTPWVSDMKNLIPFVLKNARMITMAEGDVMNCESNPEDGLFIIMSGLIRVTTRFAEESEHKMDHSVFADTGHGDYLTTGSTLGEMALLTGQKYSTYATCETAVQLFHINYEAIKAALEVYVEPSLEYMLWHSCSMHIAFALLKKHPTFKNRSVDEFKTAIENGKLLTNRWEVPDGGNYENEGIMFNTEELGNYEIILVFGTAVTANSDESFVGPCIIPSETVVIFQPAETDIFVIYLVSKEAGLGTERFSSYRDYTSRETATESFLHDKFLQKAVSVDTSPVAKKSLASRSNSIVPEELPTKTARLRAESIFVINEIIQQRLNNTGVSNDEGFSLRSARTKSFVANQNVLKGMLGQPSVFPSAVSPSLTQGVPGNPGKLDGSQAGSSVLDEKIDMKRRSSILNFAAAPPTKVVTRRLSQSIVTSALGASNPFFSSLSNVPKEAP